MTRSKDHKKDVDSRKTHDERGNLSIEDYRRRLKNGKRLTDNELKDVRAAIQMIAEQAIDRYFENLDREGEEV